MEEFVVGLELIPNGSTIAVKVRLGKPRRVLLAIPLVRQDGGVYTAVDIVVDHVAKRASLQPRGESD
jgi:hypothetical protein